MQCVRGTVLHGRRLRGASSEEDAVHSRPLVNTHSAYTGHDAVRRSQLSAGTHAELARLADAHSALLDGLGLRELI